MKKENFIKIISAIESTLNKENEFRNKIDAIFECYSNLTLLDEILRIFCEVCDDELSPCSSEWINYYLFEDDPAWRFIGEDEMRHIRTPEDLYNAIIMDHERDGKKS